MTQGTHEEEGRVRQREFIQALFPKLPEFDPSWPVEIQDKWFALFRRLKAAQSIMDRRIA